MKLDIITMPLFLYFLYLIPSLVVTLSALVLNWFFALFVTSGNLPSWLRWYQPSDNPATGDVYWKKEHPDWSEYKLALGYMNRNPAQGFDQLLRANVTMESPYKVRGNININDTDGIAGWYLITCNGYFHFAYVWEFTSGRCLQGGFGWRLNNIVKGYEHKTMGQYVFTPCRLYKFGNK